LTPTWSYRFRGKNRSAFSQEAPEASRGWLWQATGAQRRGQRRACARRSGGKERALASGDLRIAARPAVAGRSSCSATAPLAKARAFPPSLEGGKDEPFPPLNSARPGRERSALPLRGGTRIETPHRGASMPSAVCALCSRPDQAPSIPQLASGSSKGWGRSPPPLDSPPRRASPSAQRRAQLASLVNQRLPRLLTVAEDTDCSRPVLGPTSSARAFRFAVVLTARPRRCGFSCGKWTTKKAVPSQGPPVGATKAPPDRLPTHPLQRKAQ